MTPLSVEIFYKVFEVSSAPSRSLKVYGRAASNHPPTCGYLGLQYNTLRRRTLPGRAPVRHTAHLIHALAWFGSTISRAPFHAGGRTVERSAYRLKLVLIVHAAMVGQQLPCVLSEYAIPHDAFSRPGPRRAFCLHITPFPAVACFPLPKACACRARTCWGFLRLVPAFGGPLPRRVRLPRSL